MSTWAIVANVHGDRLFREGARVWVLFQHENLEIECRGRSLGGRVIQRYVRGYRLSNVRPGWVAEATVYRGVTYETKEAAAAAAGALWVAILEERARRAAAPPPGPVEGFEACSSCGGWPRRVATFPTATPRPRPLADPIRGRVHLCAACLARGAAAAGGS